MKPPDSWDEGDVFQLIKNKTEESISLDFKDADALQTTERAKSEIGKDVSAFANSAGGTIIYGIKESNARPHFAAATSPVDAAVASKEWLEQVINSRVQPRIPGVHIDPVELRTHAPGKFVYVVTIPESFTAHQASDKRYYKRFNFESVPMEDYEVRHAMTRASRPAYQFQLSKVVWAQGNPIRVRFTGVLQNMSEIVGHALSVLLFVPRDFVEHPDDYAEDVAGVSYTRIVASHTWSPPPTTKLAIDAAHPLTPYQVEFSKTVFFVVNPPPAERFTVYVRVYDSFGFALSSTYHVYMASGEIRLATEVLATKRAPAQHLEFP